MATLLAFECPPDILINRSRLVKGHHPLSSPSPGGPSQNFVLLLIGSSMIFNKLKFIELQL